MLRRHPTATILLEWLVWIALALVAYKITYVFDKPLESYRYGATGWPRFIFISIMLGATLQLVFSYFRWEQQEPEEADLSDVPAAKFSAVRAVRTAAIFGIPLIYLWLLPRTGFYLTTPLFIIAYLAVLNVRSWKPFVIVTAVVYGLVLLIFTRLFYVALPVGNWQPFYDINNAIIVAVRAGM